MSVGRSMLHLEVAVRELSIREARNSMSRIDELLRKEKEIILTRRGKPIARLVALEPGEVPSHADLRTEIGPMRRASTELIREDRDRF
jgi:antitoxin (DNA-binding transcriptional repressor) of toxin-antitoxin stability system